MRSQSYKIIGLFFGAVFLCGCSVSAPAQTEVTTVAAKKGTDLSKVTWQGNIEAQKTVDVLPNSGGKVTDVPVKEGQIVRAGEVLFQLDSTDAGLALKQAEASCHSAQAAFASAEAAKKENTSVLPAQINSRDARDNYNRIKVLFDSGDVSQMEMEAARSKMEAADVQLKAAQNGQNGSYDTTKAQLEASEAALEIAKKKFSDCTVTSPIDGLVSAVAVESGQSVTPQTVAVTVVDNSKEIIIIQVPDTDISQLSVGMAAEVRLQSEGTIREGKIDEISPVCDPQTGMFKVKASLNPEAEKKQSWIGLSANVRLTETENSVSSYIPAKAVASDENGSYVFVAVDGKAVRRNITLGKKKNAYLEVTDGVSAGEPIILQSSKTLEDGNTVRILTVK